MGLLKKVLKKAPGPKTPAMKKLAGDSKKPAAVGAAAPAGMTTKPQRVSGRGEAVTPSAPAMSGAPVGRGPRSRTPRHHEP